MYLPVQSRPEINGFELKIGNRRYLFADNDTPFNNSSSAKIAVDKYRTNQLLAMADIPVPKGVSVHTSEFKSETYHKKIAGLKFPLVIKPLTGSLGVDVLCNIQSLDELTNNLTHFFSLYDDLIIEEFHGNLRSYRVLVFNRKIIGVVLCRPASVVGDGKHNLKELVELTNQQRKAMKDPGIGPIVLDNECQIRLKTLDIDLNYIPSRGEFVPLGYTSNGTRGGSFESINKKICKENRQLMIRVADALNLNLTGIDVECEDIMRPLGKKGVILEVNYKPCVRIHELPMAGKPCLVTKRIMRSFIWRHPISYVYHLYSTKPTAIYIKSILVLGVACILGLFIN